MLYLINIWPLNSLRWWNYANYFGHEVWACSASKIIAPNQFKLCLFKVWLESLDPILGGPFHSIQTYRVKFWVVLCLVNKIDTLSVAFYFALTDNAKITLREAHSCSKLNWHLGASTSTVLRLCQDGGDCSKCYPPCFKSVEIQTRGCRMRSTKATSMPCLFVDSHDRPINWYTD